jgi:hypothetical protein
MSGITRTSSCEGGRYSFIPGLERIEFHVTQRAAHTHGNVIARSIGGDFQGTKNRRIDDAME